MYSELVDLGHRLEENGDLPPAGFASYREPIKWLIHLWPDRAVLEPVTIEKARPFSGRTSGVEAHLLADEAAYVLGVATKDDGSDDRHAAAKHSEKFRPLYQAFRLSGTLKDLALGEVIDWLDKALDEEWLRSDPRWPEVRSKDWVSIMPESGPLADTHLYLHADARAYWVEEMQRRCSQGDDSTTGQMTYGECAICGKTRLFIRKLPLKIKLASATPLHSLNTSAFTSFLGGPAPEKRTHLGMCFRCGELSARAFNHLGESGQNRLQLVRHPTSRESLTNQYALYWLKAPTSIIADDREVEFSDLESMAFTIAIQHVERLDESTVNEMTDLLKVPWAPKDSSLRLNDFGFYLAILSPNVGRIAIRDWLPLSIEPVKQALSVWLDGSRMYHLYRDTISPISIPTLVEALGNVGAEMTRSLVRTAYGESPPPRGLITLAGQRLNTFNAQEPMLREREKSRRQGSKYWDRDWTHALAGAIRFVRQSQPGGDAYMETVNTAIDSPAYHCGRLLAMLEEAQQVYTYHQYGERLKVSIVQRGYGGAAATPNLVLGRMFRLANSVHLPRAGKDLNVETEAIVQRIDALGGAPKRLTADQQTDFGLGFLQQKGWIRKFWQGKKAPEGITDDEYTE